MITMKITTLLALLISLNVQAQSKLKVNKPDTLPISSAGWIHAGSVKKPLLSIGVTGTGRHLSQQIIRFASDTNEVILYYRGIVDSVQFGNKKPQPFKPYTPEKP